MAFMLGDFTGGLFGGFHDTLALAKQWEELKDKRAMNEAAEEVRAGMAKRGDTERAPPLKTSTDTGGATTGSSGPLPDLNSIPSPDFMTRKPKTAVELYEGQQGVASGVIPAPAASRAPPVARAMPGANATQTAPIRDTAGNVIGMATPGTTATVTRRTPQTFGQWLGVTSPEPAAPPPSAMPDGSASSSVSAPAPRQTSMGGIPTLGSALGMARAPTAAAPAQSQPQAQPQTLGQWLGVTAPPATPTTPAVPTAPAAMPPGAQTMMLRPAMPTQLAMIPIDAQIVAALNGQGPRYG